MELKPWQPDLNFFKSGEVKFEGSEWSPTTTIRWSFNRIRVGPTPIFLSECAMEGWGISSRGYGSSDESNLSFKKSFCEAWERLVVNKLRLVVTKLPTEIEITIIDDGPGFAPHILERVLSEGFTTKQTGYGIGLKSSTERIHGWGGTIEITSELNKGTNIAIRLAKV